MMNEPKRRAFLAPLLILCALLILLSLYCRPLRMYFMQDDWETWMYFTPGKGVNWARVFGDFYSDLSNTPGVYMYRPFFGLFYAVNYLLFGLHAGRWHMSGIVLHTGALASLLYYISQLCQLWRVPFQRLFFPCLLLCAVHPVLGEMLSFLGGGNTDLLCWMPSIGAVAFFHSGFRRALDGRGLMGSWIPFGVSLGFFAAAFLAKEQALGIPLALFADSVILLARCRSGSWKRRLMLTCVALAPYAALTLVYLSIRARLFGLDNVFMAYSRKTDYNLVNMGKRLLAFWAHWWLYHNPVQLNNITRLLSITSPFFFYGGLFVLGFLTARKRMPREYLQLGLHAILVGLCLSVPVLWRLQGRDGYMLSLATAIGLVCALAGAGLRPSQAANGRAPGFFEGLGQWHWASKGLLAITFFAWAFLLHKQFDVYAESSQINRRLYRLVNDRADQAFEPYTFEILNMPHDHMGVQCAWRWSFLPYPFRKNESRIRAVPVGAQRLFCVLFGPRDRLVDLDAFRRMGKPVRSSADGGFAISGAKTVFSLVSAEPFAPHPNLHLYVRFHLKAPVRPGFMIILLHWKPKGAQPWEAQARGATQVVYTGQNPSPRYQTVFSFSFNPLWAKDKEVSEMTLLWIDYTLDNSLDVQIDEAVLYDLSDAVSAPAPSHPNDALRSSR